LAYRAESGEGGLELRGAAIDERQGKQAVRQLTLAEVRPIRAHTSAPGPWQSTRTA
jgi:hypothetical protein